MSSVEQFENGSGSDARAGRPAAEASTGAEGTAAGSSGDWGGDEMGGSMSFDVVFDILRNQRRRHVYRYLREVGSAETGDLSEHVAAVENGKEASQLTPQERKRAYVGLYQSHLPRMDEAGIVEFDSDRGRVELTDRASQLDAYLGEDAGSGRRWPLWYGGIVGLGALAYVLSWIVPTSTALALPSFVVLVLVVSIASCAIVHYWSEVRHGP